jgi:hypothetical protein
MISRTRCFTVSRRTGNPDPDALQTQVLAVFEVVSPNFWMRSMSVGHLVFKRVLHTEFYSKGDGIKTLRALETLVLTELPFSFPYPTGRFEGIV